MSKMIEIQVDEEVYNALDQRAVGFKKREPNDVLRAILFGEDSLPKNGSAKLHPLVRLVQSPEFQVKDGKERYFAVLHWLYTEHKDFGKRFDGFKLGSRVQIASKRETIESSGKATHPQKLENTGLWVMTNLSHPRKRSILRAILKLLNYENGIIEAVIKGIPDSEMTRNRILPEFRL